MILVRIEGGIGNQLFQYSFLQLLRSRGFSVYAELSFYNRKKSLIKKLLLFLFGVILFEKIHLRELLIDRIFDINIEESSSFNNEDFIIIKQQEIENNPMILDLLSPNRNYYLKGTWSDLKYLPSVSQFYFKFKSIDLKNRNNLISRQIEMTKNSVSIHVRRTDYLKNKESFITINYYKEAVNQMRQMFQDDLIFFIFSDDISWVKKNLNFPGSVIITGNTFRPEDDFVLMSKCKNHIIANSTFSWWAAFLNTHQNKKVVAPKFWSPDLKFVDSGLYVQGWIVV
jgi:hypothetical protein